MRSRHRLSHALMAICSLTLTQLVALESNAQQKVTDADRAGARTAATAGLEAFEAGRYEEAIDLFKRAESIIHSPLHQLYIARSQIALGKLVSAHEVLVQIQREAGSSDIAGRAAEDASKELEALKPRIPKLTTRVEGADGQPVTLSMDGEQVPAALIGIPRPVDPGEHTLTAEAGGKTAAPVKVVLAEGETKEVALLLEGSAPAVAPVQVTEQPSEVPPAQEPEAEQGGMNPMRIGAYVGFGVGAVGLGLGTVFALSASGKSSDADDLCSEATGDKSCSGLPEDDPIAVRVQDLDDQASSARTMSMVGFVVGGLGVAAGVTLFVLSNQDDSEAVSMSPWIGYRSAGISGRF